MPHFQEPPAPRHEACEKAYLILKYAHDTSESLLDAFSRLHGGGRGAPTDEQQDLLRAMVVFAGAGIDAMTKQLIRDALPVMVETVPDARQRVEKLVPRHLRRGGGDADDETDISLSVNPQRLAKVLLASSPQAGLVELLIGDLTAGSLQSADELYRVASYLGIDRTSLGATDAPLRAVFDCRNKLIHEMDIDFSQPNRNRFPRRRNDMVTHTRTILDVSRSILGAVDAQLPAPPPPRRGRPRQT